MIQWYKADNPQAQFIFAHGAGAGMDSEFMQKMAGLLCNKQINVGLFNFEYMQKIKAEGKRRPPERTDKLLTYFDEILAQAAKESDLPLFIGGKSMGGRMASMIVSDKTYLEHDIVSSVKGVIVFGYPFHPPGKPDKLRTAHFPDLNCLLSVMQGQRDIFGTESEVSVMKLADNIQLNWLPDGDHSLIPRKKSGFTQEQNWISAAEKAVDFINEQLS
ncbi:alpha/beta hydrolase [Pseudoalteromonas sp. NBT06-2]|uniref:alpha/beta family hydrolase n=1 Tax=Pseudoalteromonas sp. NBT06-2 TaxID=2025950 RepID=UPI000BA6DB53|nr:alpha/beta family hydrolase [Pseudoalteromonas sp. NBT06-2]PAJ72276.1 alpha/beta hydrolase [Pseudoalteromonas sp. NBT06-2]